MDAQPAAAPSSTPLAVQAIDEPVEAAQKSGGVPVDPDGWLQEPVEPAQGTPGSTKLRLTLPDHTVVTRRFLLADTVQVLHQFVRWKVQLS